MNNINALHRHDEVRLKNTQKRTRNLLVSVNCAVHLCWQEEKRKIKSVKASTQGVNNFLSKVFDWSKTILF